MPYIKADRRKVFNKYLIPLLNESHYDVIWSLILAYADKRGHCYTTYNAILGVLTAVIYELRRRPEIAIATNRHNSDTIIHPKIEQLSKLIDTPGELNYCIMQIIRHTDLDAAEEMMELIINKFYHNVVAPYEDHKIKENGDLEELL